MARFVGVDGCRFGWVAVAEEAGRLEYRLFGAMSDVLAAHPDAERILVDIPIGLPSKQCPARPCDLLARKLLGAPRASSVFPPPSRAACKAASVAEARRINLSEVERSLSEQAWGICRKVAEVDALLLAQSASRKVVREMHPEVCFYGLNARRPMAYAKRTKAGAAERLTVLTAHEPRTRALLERLLREHRRKDVQADDVLDALVGYVTDGVDIAGPAGEDAAHKVTHQGSLPGVAAAPLAACTHDTAAATTALSQPRRCHHCAAAQPDWLRQGFLRRGRQAVTLPTGWRHDHSP